MENGIDMIIIQLNHNKNMRVILILIILFSSFVLNAQVAKIPYVYATKGGKTELIAENVHFISNVMQWEHFAEMGVVYKL